MGGTIKLITAKPDPTKFSGKAQAELSNTEGGGTNYNATPWSACPGRG